MSIAKLRESSYFCSEQITYMHKRFILFLLMIGCGLTAMAQKVIVAGHITDDDSHKPIAFATLYIKESGHWAVTDDDGSFTMRNVPVGKVTLTIQCLGYATRQLTFNIARDVPRMRITLQQETLKLDEVTITAQRKNNESTTSYTIDRTALDNQQIVSVSDLSTLCYTDERHTHGATQWYTRRWQCLVWHSHRS